jgi:threonylcarbamoyladenosine tRNA methylthiotransferase MtaB
VRYAIVTFGCRVNQADSLRIEEDLQRRGALEAAPADADVVVVNTCSVTATADQGARQTIRRIARDNPSARIVVTGCYATREPGDITDLPNVVRLVTNADKDRLVDQVWGPADGQTEGATTAERFGSGE